MQRIDQVATFALVNLHDMALKTHIFQQVAGRQREVVGHQSHTLDDGRLDDKRAIDMDAVGNE